MNKEQNDIAIRVENLSKCYQIYDTPRDRLRQFILPRVYHLTGQTPRQYFREFWALKDISFEVKKGETIGIIGRNGSGKSTLLQLICGTLSPTSGSITTHGRIAALLELGSGFNPEFTGRENVYLSCALLGLGKEETDACFDDIVMFADIGDFIEQPVKTYSSGMFVRLAFAVNIVFQPEIMVVDEALAVGDMAYQAKCMTALRRLQDKGATVLFVSHDIGSIKSLCSQAVYLEHGLLKSFGKAASIAEDYVRTVREEMNCDLKAAPMQIDDLSSKHFLPSSKVGQSSIFKVSDEFDERTKLFRYGKGGARIRFAELVDMNDQPVVSAEFNQQVKIKIYLDVQTDMVISVNYYIQDDKKNLILGAGLSTVGEPLLHGTPDSRYSVVYTTRLPLQEGNYSIHLELTSPIVKDQSAEFLDVIDDAIVFNVQRRANRRIWAKVYVENNVEVSPV
ncbi:ABC transporter ATP-binding protein [Nitrosomonas eutropha]|uniref:ABC transporter ATP-binding protein n=1 Tax=Nitrosomonas eutropha TaxID=916 RepID=UPI0008CFE1DE|nr:ABC transporter ATP-binding protein [Nitrosomonas eutropha]SEI50138.1 lipopolysaccharide transport system ATP-binding protein [Nitrosomonas eutropha]